MNLSDAIILAGGSLFEIDAGGVGSGRHKELSVDKLGKHWRVEGLSTFKAAQKEGSAKLVLVNSKNVIQQKSNQTYPELVEKYAKAMKSGAQFPVIMAFGVSGNKVRIRDGHHRFVAWTKTLGNKTIPLILRHS